MRVRDVLFPRKCACCGVYLSHENTSAYDEVCTVCAEDIFRVRPPYCSKCFRGKDSCRCYRERPRAYDCVVSPFYYEGAIKHAMMRLKFEGKESVARFLGRELGVEVATRYFGIPFDLITCVPATSQSLSERSFNQSSSIAENLALLRFGFPDIATDYNLLVKRPLSSAQHHLGAGSRYRNSAMAYELNKNRDISDNTILLIDDIITTGSTADECARVLKLEGAGNVYLATAAITRFKDEESESDFSKEKI